MNREKNIDISITPDHKFFVLSNINYNLPFNSAIASLWCPKNPFTFDTETILKFFKCLNVSNFRLVIITENEEILKMKSIVPPFVVLFNLDGFTEAMGNKDINAFLGDVLFIADNIPWALIVRAGIESDNNITISGGSSNKRHLISKLDTRLVIYLMAIFKLNYQELNWNNGFDIQGKTSILPFMDTSQKGQIRITSSEGLIKVIANPKFEYNKSTTPNNTDSYNNTSNVETDNNNMSFSNKHDNTNGKTNGENNSINTLAKKNINSFFTKRGYTSLTHIRKVHTKNSNRGNNSLIFTYLDSVQSIFEKYKDNTKLAQLEIETSWIDIMKAKMSDPKFIKWQKMSSIIKNSEDIISNYNKRGYLKKKFPEMSDDIVNLRFECLLIAYSFILSHYSKISYTALSGIVGNHLYYIIKRHKDKSGSNEVNTVDELTNIERLKLGAFFLEIFTNYPNDIFEKTMKKSGSSYQVYLSINPVYLEEIKDNIIIHPTTLPMVCEPNTWSNEKSGGVIRNEADNSLIIGSVHHNHTVENKELIYKAVNYVNKIKFSINKELLYYIIKEGAFLLECESGEKRLQNDITLKIAEVYKDIPFYLNVQCDWRARIYTTSFFISYQGGDLSSSILQFTCGEKLTESGKNSLYIWGANCYNENKISKLSYEKRINWVIENYDNIIKMDRDFINKAESGIQFASFCLTMRQLKKNPDYLVKLPIFLDATCSGLQHLAALLSDFELGSKVNLVPSDNVQDLYESLVDPLNNEINNYALDNIEYYNLHRVKLTRKILKTSIMTQVYNVSVFGVKDQLITHFKPVKVVAKNIFYKVPAHEGHVYLSHLEVFKMAQIVHSIIFKQYPTLKLIYNYFINIVKLMLNLPIPVVWFTPTGLKITQQYNRSVKKKIRMNYFGKSSTMVLREFTNQIDKTKQKDAIIPNIIHSLDASHLMRVICDSSDHNFNPVITVHDCFGTHPNKLDELSFIVRKEFVILYTQYNYLNDFHNRVIQSINDNKYVIIDNKVITDKGDYDIPKLPQLGKLDLNKIIYSKYMIT